MNLYPKILNLSREVIWNIITPSQGVVLSGRQKCLIIKSYWVDQLRKDIFEGITFTKNCNVLGGASDEVFSNKLCLSALYWTRNFGIQLLHIPRIYSNTKQHRKFPSFLLYYEILDACNIRRLAWKLDTQWRTCQHYLLNENLRFSKGLWSVHIFCKLHLANTTFSIHSTMEFDYYTIIIKILP